MFPELNAAMEKTLKTDKASGGYLLIKVLLRLSGREHYPWECYREAILTWLKQTIDSGK